MSEWCWLSVLFMASASTDSHKPVEHSMSVTTMVRSIRLCSGFGAGAFEGGFAFPFLARIPLMHRARRPAMTSKRHDPRTTVVIVSVSILESGEESMVE